jgi:hypothetical protein
MVATTSDPDAWAPLGAVAPGDLVPVRLALHHAAQLVTAAGRSLLPARPDDSQTAFTWRPGLQALLGEELPGRVPLRVGLRPADLSLLVLADGATQAVALAGRTLQGGLDWLRERLEAGGLDGRRLSTAVPYELPDHPIAHGQPFALEPAAAYQELARWFAAGDALVRGAVASRVEATAVRCWPHHFDVGSLILPKPRREDRDPPSIGVGLSPGDETFPEPYLYVTAWPHDDRPALPALPHGGAWHTQEWLGAVLTGSALLAGGPDAEQETRARAFLASALAAADRIVA